MISVRPGNVTAFRLLPVYLSALGRLAGMSLAFG